MNRADLHAIDIKLLDCNTRLAAARKDSDLAHQLQDLRTDRGLLLAKRSRLAGSLGDIELAA